MHEFIVAYWPLASVLIGHGISFIWMISNLSNRIRHIERQLDNYRNVHERLAKLEAMSVAVAQSVRRIENHLLRHQH